MSHLGARLGLSEALLEPSWAILDAPARRGTPRPGPGEGVGGGVNPSPKGKKGVGRGNSLLQLRPEGWWDIRREPCFCFEKAMLKAEPAGALYQPGLKGELSGEPREMNMESRLHFGPTPSKTITSKEPRAMPSHAARCCVLCRCAMPCFALQCFLMQCFTTQCHAML